MAGGYPVKYAFISPDFLTNHLDVYLNFFSRRTGMHSVTNSPDSVYDQLLSEYGLAGILIFLVFYIGYFLKQRRYLSYGLPLLLFAGCVFFTNYWFEQLSIVVLLELLLLADIRENQLRKLHTAHEQ
jgi:glycerol uptake facilitator-like aquaporin